MPSTGWRVRRFLRRTNAPVAALSEITAQPDSMTRPQQLKVLISAYSCEPGYGSERGQGWNWSAQAARAHEVTVLTVSRGRSSIERSLREPGSPNLTFHYLDVPLWPRRWSDQDTLIRLHYVLWQIIALPAVLRLHRRRRFDLVHHVTFNAVDLPGFLWLLRAPFVWGPVGGGQLPSPILKHYFGRRWHLEQLRILRKRMIPFNPIVRLAVRRSATLMYVNADTRAILRRAGATDLVQAIDAGVEQPGMPVTRSNRKDTQALRIAWAGVLTQRKSPDLALDVAVALKERQVPFILSIAGDGPLRSKIATRISSLGLGNDVDLLGNLPHHRMDEFFSNSDVFLFTSLHDTSGNVLLEAMAHALPVVCLDQHGAAEIVSDDCGFKVNIISRDQVITDLAQSVERLAREPELRAALGAAGSQRVRDSLSWDRKRDLLLTVYRRAVEADR